MAHIEIWYRCPVCNRLFKKQKEAFGCRNQHTIVSERWAVGFDGKGVRIFDNCSPNSKGGVNWALKEADLSDFIEERKQQLKMM